MFFENTFVQLMENVRYDTLEDVGVGEICPEGAIDFLETVVLEKVGIFSSLMLSQGL